MTEQSGSVNCLAIGTRLAEFEIRSVIGEGGFGIVYLAFDHSLQRTVAIKEYMPAALAARGADHSVSIRSKRHGEAFEAGLRSFINEARLLAQFEHPALIKVYRFWEQHQTAYMAMRYYEGETFSAVCKADPSIVTEAWLKQIIKPVLGGLDVLYAAKILHRDISPENIMIQPNGEAVLLDFGAARQIVSGLTHSLTVILKPGYAPVEQYADDASMKQGPWTDIYSLSAVMYGAIAQKPPVVAVTRMLGDTLEKLTSEQYPAFSASFLAAIDRGLAVRPEERPQTIAEFAALLGIDMDAPAQPQPVSRAPLAAAPAAPTARPKRAVLAVAGIGALALSGALWSLTRKPAPPAVVPPIPVAATISPKEEIVSPEALDKELAAKAAPPASAPAAAPAPTPPNPAPVKKAETPAKQAAKPAGSLTLAIKPWGNVFIDGQQKGASPPLKQIPLPAGDHQVKVVNPAFPPYLVRIHVDAGKVAAVRHDFSSAP